MALAYKELQDLDRAKEHMLAAVKLDPQNGPMRAEYAELVKMKTSKEREWFDKMSGFYGSDKHQKIEKNDEQEMILREKIKR